MKDFVSLGLLINRAATALAISMNTALINNGVDLPHSQFIVLRCLYFNGAMTQLDIAHTLSKDAAAIKRTIDRLEEKGLVVRKAVRTLKNSVEITEKGVSVMPKVLDMAEKVTERALADVNGTERELLLTLLEKIHNNLKN